MAVSLRCEIAVCLGWLSVNAFSGVGVTCLICFFPGPFSLKCAAMPLYDTQ